MASQNIIVGRYVTTVRGEVSYQVPGVKEISSRAQSAAAFTNHVIFSAGFKDRKFFHFLISRHRKSSPHFSVLPHCSSQDFSKSNLTQFSSPRILNCTYLILTNDIPLQIDDV